LESLPACVEDGATFEENALKKALHYSAWAPGPLFADDSGLEVDALGGAPGVISARFSGPRATDRSNNALLVEKLRGVPNRAARFVCVIAVASEGRLIRTFRGEVEGRIMDQSRGAHGFGYDPLFFYEPYACTFGEVEGDRKFQVSHRGRALRAMLDYLDRELFQRK
jgi:XTP/dITP diphosphohydrolase